MQLEPNTIIKIVPNSKQSPAETEVARLRACLHEFANLRGDNSLAEALAMRVRAMARRALAKGR